MPSLTINTNADFGDADTKKALMTKLTQVVAKGLGKPDSYVAIQINDKQVGSQAVRALSPDVREERERVCVCMPNGGTRDEKRNLDRGHR